MGSILQITSSIPSSSEGKGAQDPTPSVDGGIATLVGAAIVSLRTLAETVPHSPAPKDATLDRLLGGDTPRTGGSPGFHPGGNPNFDEGLGVQQGNRNPAVERAFEERVKRAIDRVAEGPEDTIVERLAESRKILTDLATSGESILKNNHEFNETYLKAAEYLSRPIIGLTQSPEEYRAAAKFIDGMAQTVWGDFSRENRDGARHAGIAEEIAKSPSIRAISDERLATDPEAKRQLAQEVVTITLRHFGLKDAPVVLDPELDGDGAVRHGKHEVRINPGTEGNRLHIIDTAVHEARHLVQHAITSAHDLALIENHEGRFIEPPPQTERSTRFAKLIQVAGEFMHDSLVRNSGAFDGENARHNWYTERITEIDARDAGFSVVDAIERRQGGGVELFSAR